MSAWLVASLILTGILLLVTPVVTSFQPNASPPPTSQSQNLDIAAAALPVSAHIQSPNTTARSVFIVDQASKTVLLSQAADERVLPASTTKMMTALVALDYFPLTKVVTVSQAYPIGTTVGLEPGEQLSIEQLLYALLVQSANDAAEVLAENYPGGRMTFIQAMNNKAREIHLTNTHFVNPSGIDEENHYSTATDLARLADIALRYPAFSRIVATENAVISKHVLTNVNQLLGKIPGVIGIKTGYTEGAGQALVTLVERENHPVILVVLGSTDRFGDTATLIDWVYRNWSWTDPVANKLSQ